jgi:hypothetical protein
MTNISTLCRARRHESNTTWTTRIGAKTIKRWRLKDRWRTSTVPRFLPCNPVQLAREEIGVLLLLQVTEGTGASARDSERAAMESWKVLRWTCKHGRQLLLNGGWKSVDEDIDLLGMPCRSSRHAAPARLANCIHRAGCMVGIEC